MTRTEALSLPPSFLPARMIEANGRLVVMSIADGLFDGLSLVTIDARDWTVISTATERGAQIQPRDLGLLDAETLFIGSGAARGVYLYPVEGQASLGRFIALNNAQGGAAAAVTQASLHPASGRLLASVSSDFADTSAGFGGVHLLDPQETTLATTPFADPIERQLDAWSSGPWPSDAALSLVLLSERDGPGYAGLVEPEQVRFLPEPTPIPGVTGGASRLIFDEGGAGYALFPYSAHVVRITPSDRAAGR